MLQSLRASALDVNQQNVLSIINGLDTFLANATGDVDDDGDNVANAYIINNQGIIANNLHFEGGPQGYSPTQCGTTEGQALLIQGYYYIWKATGNPAYLAKAELYLNAYITYFYGGIAPPNPPDVYASNWMINAKNPFTAYGPTSIQNPDSPGYLGIPVTFTNGVGNIPAGGTTFGDQLVRLYQVYTGQLGYVSVQANPTDGGVDLPFTSYTATNGSWDSNGDSVSTPEGAIVGNIVLSDLTYNGTANVAYVIADGGVIERNALFDVWPTWRALTPDQWGNSIDSEQWFCEICLLMYQATGNELYNNVYLSSFETCVQASIVDDVTTYFNQEVGGQLFDYGISYWWDYSPSTSVTTMVRDIYGNTVATKTAETGTSAGTVAMEQIAIFNRIVAETSMQVNMSLSSPTARIQFFTLIQPTLNDAGVEYRYAYHPGIISTITPLNIPFNQMISVTATSGNDNVMLDGGSFVPFGSAYGSSEYQTFTVNGTTYTDWVGVLTVPDVDSGMVIGFWDNSITLLPLESLTYKSLNTYTMYLTLTDTAGVKWWYPLPYSAEWTTITLSSDWSEFTLVPYQTPTPTEIVPSVNTLMEQIIFETDSADAASIAVYCWGELPRYYVPSTDWSTTYYLHVSDVNAFTWTVGNVVIQNEYPAGLNYTPGVVPFSNQYSPSVRRNEFWRGTPYAGYQYPVNWANQNLTTYVDNCVDFYYDAQQSYHSTIGVLGPFSPVYVWPRYDDLGAGPVDTFSWGTDSPYPWGGYEARAFWSACHLWATQVRLGQPVNEKLITVCQNYAAYLLNFQQNNGGLTPSDFPSNAPAFNDGYTSDPETSDPSNVGHMTALFMAGCIEMLNAGDNTGIPIQVINGCWYQLQDTYVIEQGTYQHMSGSYSSYVGGFYFYGFWGGEILRALGLLLIWLKEGNKLSYQST